MNTMGTSHLLQRFPDFINFVFVTSEFNLLQTKLRECTNLINFPILM